MFINTPVWSTTRRDPRNHIGTDILMDPDCLRSKRIELVRIGNNIDEWVTVINESKEDEEFDHLCKMGYFNE